MSRALSPVIGTLLLVAVTVVTAAAVGAVVTVETGTVVPTSQLSLSADADADRVALTHEGGETLRVSDLSITIRIDGEKLDRQPPVPFFAARGFESGPTGPFNTASDDTWSAGETAAVRLASTNDPPLTPGAYVEVTVATDAGVVATAGTTAT